MSVTQLFQIHDAFRIGDAGIPTSSWTQSAIYPSSNTRPIPPPLFPTKQTRAEDTPVEPPPQMLPPLPEEKRLLLRREKPALTVVVVPPTMVPPTIVPPTVVPPTMVPPTIVPPAVVPVCPVGGHGDLHVPAPFWETCGPQTEALKEWLWESGKAGPWFKEHAPPTRWKKTLEECSLAVETKSEVAIYRQPMLIRCLAQSLQRRVHVSYLDGTFWDADEDATPDWLRDPGWMLREIEDGKFVVLEHEDSLPAQLVPRCTDAQCKQMKVAEAREYLTHVWVALGRPEEEVAQIQKMPKQTCLQEIMQETMNDLRR